jgi:DNA topoisomerase-1
VRLRRADPNRPGIRRVRHGRGFRYLGADGEPVDAETTARIKELVIPPAWNDVWICPQPNGHLQAVGTDDAGRRQYLYHPEYRRRQDATKHQRVLELARRLPAVRAEVAADLRGPGLTRRRVVGAALRMLDHGVFRTGGEEYAAQNGSQGVATLNRDDVRVRAGELTFRYTAKGGQDRELTLLDPPLATVVTALRRSRPPGTERLLTYRDTDGWHEVHASDVNARFKELAGDDYTVKDLRTWHATVLATVGLCVPAPESERGRRRLVRSVLADVADELGNTPAVARRSYVDPRVLELFEQDAMPGLDGIDASRLTREAVRTRAERAVIRLLT